MNRYICPSCVTWISTTIETSVALSNMSGFIVARLAGDVVRAINDKRSPPAAPAGEPTCVRCGFHVEPSA